MKVLNSKGKIYYGMHFYPGVAEYTEPGRDPYRIFLNENTIRNMDPSFAGRPVFVEHVEEVEEDPDELRKDADGWVIESFFNAADGKHWVKFISITDRCERAIQSGMKLSNAYVPQSFSEGGLWNGVQYSKEVIAAEYEHLAIVSNPRYEESIILTPEEFKRYNEGMVTELKRLSNSKDHQKGDSKMKLNLFKRAKVENSADLENMSVVLPKSGKEMTLTELVTEHDKIVNMHGYANDEHMVKVGENEMSVKDLVGKHMEACNALDEMKKNAEMGESELAEKKQPVEVEGDLHNEDEAMENEEDDEEDKKENEDEEEKKDDKAEKKQNALELDKKKKLAKEKADRLRNARETAELEEVATVDLAEDQVKRGQQRYGS